jgi:hypothetical protein
MPGHRAGQYGPFYVRTKPNQIVDIMAVIDPHDVLFDDRPLIKIRRDVMRRCANKFDATLAGPPIG